MLCSAWRNIIKSSPNDITFEKYLKEFNSKVPESGDLFLLFSKIYLGGVKLKKSHFKSIFTSPKITDCYLYSTNFKSSTIPSIPNTTLTSLDVCDIDLSFNDVKRISNNLTCLKKLVIGNLSSRGVNLVMNGRLSKLETLDIRSLSPITTSSVTMIFQPKNILSNLTELSVRGSIAHSSFFNYFESMSIDKFDPSKFPKLVSLGLFKIELDAESVSRIINCGIQFSRLILTLYVSRFSRIERVPSLQHLQVDSINTISGNIEQEFVDNIVKHVIFFSLEHLEIPFINDSQLRTITETVNDLKTLHVAARRGNLSGNSLCCFCEKFRNVISLRLPRCNIDLDGVKHISKLLFVQYLDVSDGLFGSEGAEYIFGMQSLTYLNITRCQIGNDGLKYSSNGELINLKTLDIRNIGIDDESMKLFANTKHSHPFRTFS